MSKHYNGYKILFFLFFSIAMVRNGSYKWIKKNQNDYIIDIFQDFCEIESIIKILKEALHCKDNEIQRVDIVNSLEIIFAKTSNTKISLGKYIDNVF